MLEFASQVASNFYKVVKGVGYREGGLHQLMAPIFRGYHSGFQFDKLNELTSYRTPPSATLLSLGAIFI